MKASGHELKSLKAYTSCRISGLHFPLMALVKYRGFIVIVQSILPIDSSTLRSGSMDAGKQILSSDEKLYQKLEQAAKKLNLKPHFVKSRSDGKRVLICSAADIEGHYGKDSRYYLIDLHR